MATSRRLQREIAQFHRALFVRNRGLINAAVGDYTPELTRYEARYRRCTTGYLRRARWPQLVAVATGSDVVYIGDYHTLPTAQRACAKLLRAICEDSDQVVLALEFVLSAHQDALDAYQAGQLRDEAFLRRIEYERQWMLGGWEHYRPLLELARAYGVPVIGINTHRRGPGAARSLAARDAHMAERIADAMRRWPKARLVVQVGELHVCPLHLPAAVARAARRAGLPRRQHLVVYQNSDQLYHQLMEQGLAESTEVLQVAARTYCLINTPPVIVQQSFLNWLEAQGDEDAFAERDAEGLFRECATAIAGFLGLELGDLLDRIEVVSVLDLSFWARLRRRGLFTRRELALIKEQILSSESYTIGRAGLVYLAKLSMNHAAEEAAHFLRHSLTEGEEPSGLVDAFYARVLEEALAFFGSKLINPKRKTEHEWRLRQTLRRARAGERLPAAQVTVATWALAHKAMEAGGPARHLEAMIMAPVEPFNAVTHTLGYMLGDRLYYAAMGGQVGRDELRDLFETSFEEERLATRTYFYWAQRLAEVVVPRRV